MNQRAADCRHRWSWLILHGISIMCAFYTMFATWVTIENVHVSKTIMTVEDGAQTRVSLFHVQSFRDGGRLTNDSDELPNAMILLQITVLNWLLCHLYKFVQAMELTKPSAGYTVEEQTWIRSSVWMCGIVCGMIIVAFRWFVCEQLQQVLTQVACNANHEITMRMIVPTNMMVSLPTLAIVINSMFVSWYPTTTTTK